MHDDAQVSLRECDDAIASGDVSPQAYLRRGAAYERLGLHAKALSDYSQALRLSDGSQEIELAYARALVLAAPHDSTALSHEGSIWRKHDQHERALESLDRAIDLQPTNAYAWFFRASALNELGRLEEALASVRRNLTYEPSNEESINLEGEILLGLGKPREALHCFAHAIYLDGGYLLARFNQADAYEQLERWQEAADAYCALIDSSSSRGRTDPDLYVAHANVSILLEKLGRIEESVAHNELAIRLRPEHGELWFNLGALLARAGRHHESLAAFEQAIALEPNDHTSYSAYGTALHDVGRDREALAALDHSIRLQPDCSDCEDSRALRDVLASKLSS